MACVAAGLLAAPALAASPQPPPPLQPSGIGNENATWISISPKYQQSGTVVVSSSAMTNCKADDCLHLWVSRDGGASWKRAAANGWSHTRTTVVVDGAGREVLYDSAVNRSDDLGAAWHHVGDTGQPAIAPTQFGAGAVAVAANTHDYMYSGGAAQAVPGSGGSMRDISFMFAPGFPSGGRFSPALLSGGDNSQGLPLIQRCTADLHCSGGATLAGSITWSQPVTLLPSSDYANDGVVFAQSGRGVYKSTDGGASFVPLQMGQPGATGTSTPMVVLAPGYRDAGPVRTAYTAVFQVFQDSQNAKKTHTAGGVYRTTDAGASWASVGASPLSDGATTVAVAPDGRLFASYLSAQKQQAGLLCSSDGGGTWQASCGGFRSKAVAAGTTAKAGGTAAGNAAGACAQQPCVAASVAPDQGAANVDRASTVSDSKSGGASRTGSTHPAFPTFGVGAVLVLLIGGAVATFWLRRGASRAAEELRQERL